jgi:hypothetical protein
VILPLIEHALKCSPFNEESSDDEEPPDEATFGVKLMPQVDGIESQDADGKNANVCAFTGTMFLSLALGKLLKLYQVRSRPDIYATATASLPHSGRCCRRRRKMTLTSVRPNWLSF